MAFMLVVFRVRAGFADLGGLRSGCAGSGGDDDRGLLRNFDRILLEELCDLDAGEAWLWDDACIRSSEVSSRSVLASSSTLLSSLTRPSRDDTLPGGLVLSKRELAEVRRQSVRSSRCQDGGTCSNASRWPQFCPSHLGKRKIQKVGLSSSVRKYSSLWPMDRSLR